MPETAPIRPEADLETRAVNAIRALTIDATQAAGDGHPGMPMGAAAMGYVLYARTMHHDPSRPAWPNRDRYVQSAGHGSMLQYSLLHLTGYPLTTSDLAGYRQWQSLTPGHPEYGHTVGVETTTGPLGQGLATAVGMALAEGHLAARYNRPGFPVIDHHTYVIASDGDLMEGVASEAASLAGHLGLGKLIVLYDDNDISIDGSTDITFTEDVGARFAAYGWHVQDVADGNDPSAIEAAITRAKAETNRPSLLRVRTVIGFGSPNLQGTSKVHGAVLGEAEAAAAKVELGIDWPAFTVPEDVLEHYRGAGARGREAREAWEATMDAYRAAHPALAAELERVLAGELPSGFDADLPRFATEDGATNVGNPSGGAAATASASASAGAPVSAAASGALRLGKIATRKASSVVLNALAARLPEMVGGSADLAGSNLTDIDGATAMTPDDLSGRIVRFGIREHAMAAVANGLALHGGLRPFVATFLIFSDYLRPALRLSALMQQPVVYVFTHDSIGLGGDGPTHQPIEQLMSLRLIPNVNLIRPADPNETAQAWDYALRNQDGPTVLALTRQGVRTLNVPDGAVRRGAYVLAEAGGQLPGAASDADAPAETAASTARPDVLLIGTGSEVALCLDAQAALASQGVRARVVSMPNALRFEQQDAAYKEAVLPSAVRARVTVEAGATRGWERYAGDLGSVIGIDHFGASAPGDVVMRAFGFTTERVVQAARDSLERVARATAAGR